MKFLKTHLINKLKLAYLKTQIPKKVKKSKNLAKLLKNQMKVFKAVDKFKVIKISFRSMETKQLKQMLTAKISLNISMNHILNKTKIRLKIPPNS